MTLASMFNFLFDKINWKKPEHPVAYIWLPDPPTNPYGHASIRTDKYNMSFWPENPVKQDGVVQMLSQGIKGSIVYHHNYDFFLEDFREPEKIVLDKVSVDKLHEVYEEFLRYNDIKPEDVTLDAGDRVIKNKGYPSVPVSKTLYSITGTSYSKRHFYKKANSCTSFVSGLIANSSLNNRFANFCKAKMPRSPLVTSKPLIEALLQINPANPINSFGNSYGLAITTEVLLDILKKTSDDKDYPMAYIWLSGQSNNQIQHASIKTNKYNMSFRPDTKEGVVKMLFGETKGTIVYHHDHDLELEDDREPEQIVLDSISEDKLHELYEEFLRYNDIKPEDVTLDAGAKVIKDSGSPTMSVSKTLYSIFIGLYSARDFYKKANSSISFVAGLVDNSVQDS